MSTDTLNVPNNLDSVIDKVVYPTDSAKLPTH